MVRPTSPSRRRRNGHDPERSIPTTPRLGCDATAIHTLGAQPHEEPLYPGPLRRQGWVEACLEFSLSPAEPVVKRASGGVCEVCPERALPDDRHSPTAFQQFLPCAPITLHVGAELGLPELAPRGRIGCSRATRMAMPETAVNEAGRPEARKDEIRRPGKAPNMKPISAAKSVERSPQAELGFRISHGDARHDARAGCLIHRIGHGQSCSTPRCGDRARIPPDIEGGITCRFNSRHLSSGLASRGTRGCLPFRESLSGYR